MTFTSILPPHAQPIMRAVEEAAATRLSGVDIPLRTLWDPWGIDEVYLPWLAWALRVDIWDPTWPPDKKRSVIARILSLYRKKGTEDGIAGYLDIVGAELVDTLTPQDRPWALPDRAAEVTAAWKSRLKQLRVYTRKTRRPILPVESFANHCYANHAWAWPDTPETVEGRKSFVYDPATGEETPLQRYEYTTSRTTVTEERVERSVLPMKSGPNTPWVNHCYANYAFLVDPEPAEVLTTTVRVEGEISHTDLIVETIKPSLKTTEIWPERVPITVRQPHIAAANYCYANHCYALPNTAELGYYDKWYIVSRETPKIDAKPIGIYANYTRLQPELHTAYLYAKHIRRVKKAYGFANHFYAGFAFAAEEDMSHYEFAWKAIRAAKSLRDQIHVTFTSTTPLNLSTPIPLDGSVNLGSRRPRRRL